LDRIILYPLTVAIHFQGGIVSQAVKHGAAERGSITGLRELRDHVITVQDPDVQAGGGGGHWGCAVDF